MISKTPCSSSILQESTFNTMVCRWLARTLLAKTEESAITTPDHVIAQQPDTPDDLAKYATVQIRSDALVLAMEHNALEPHTKRISKPASMVNPVELNPLVSLLESQLQQSQLLGQPRLE